MVGGGGGGGHPPPPPNQPLGVVLVGMFVGVGGWGGWCW